MTCEHCGHDWHGLPCVHDRVVRLGWSLGREACECGGAFRPGHAAPLAEAG